MRRFSGALLVCTLSILGACSLLNAPDDVKPGGAGGAGGTGGSSSTGPSGSCVTVDDCAAFVDECNDAACINGMCEKSPANEGKLCDDKKFCTENDTCQAGVCSGTDRKCPDMDACNVGQCDEAKRECVIVVGNEGGPCEDGEPCTSNDTCASGACMPGGPTDCSAFDSECSSGQCNQGEGCVAVPKNEGMTCGVTQCSTGTCGVDGKCSVMPANIGQPCDDGLFCSTGEKCDTQGQCSGGNPTCPKPGPCIEPICNEDMDFCDVKTIKNGELCDDGNACTAGEVCMNNVCSGGVLPVVYFTETFANNTKGWTLGTEWQIGPATASTGGVFGADPALDHTTTSDNGVAGVAIGGNAVVMVHPVYYIEGPVVDVSAEMGKLYVTYYRWLNSDYLPYMRNVVEVFDGANWVEVWTSGGPPSVQDSPPAGQGWTFMSHEITQYKNPGLRVRFGFEVKSTGAYTIGSWNLDDVKIQNAACPQ